MRARREIVLLSLAIGFLTRLPMPSVRGFERSWLASAARYFALVGVLVGVLHVVVWRIALAVLPGPLAVGLAMAASLWVTGAFHEDGFADACDGLGGGRSREHALAIMKDSRIAAFGAIGIVMMLGLKWTALTAVAVGDMAVVVIAAHMVSRLGACGVIATLRYVREGDSKAKPVADGLRPGGLAVAAVIGAAGWAAAAAGFDAWPARDQWRVLGLGLAAAAVATVLAALFFKRRLGGYTGDCLGAVQQIGELAFLVAAVAAVGAARGGAP